MNEHPSCPECGKPLAGGDTHGVCPACLMRQALASRTIIEDGNEAPISPPLSPEEIGDKFPGFEVLECLGRGGMGVVYKARQKSLGRLVAIKILPPERVGEEKFSERFAIEAATLAKLSHPNIVTVHDFGEIDGLFYIVMEYIDGVNLRDLLREGKLEPKQALAIVPPICDALQSAHDRGVVHRDIKPENILLDRDGRVKIADFGIASLMGVTGEIAGTPPYMAPEQKGPKTDHRADIYALGVVLYEMLTGERPDKDLIAPSRKVQIDVRLDEMVLRALEKEPERRYQTAGEFRTVVETMATPPVTHDSPAQLLKSGESLYATPEFLSTVWGAMKLHQGLGALLLYSDRLEFQAGLIRTVIPLRSILRLGLVSYPFFQSPAGLRSIEVEFEEAGTPRRLLLTPNRGMFSFVGTTNNRVFEWFASIREAITSATGNPPAGSHSPIPYQGLSADGRFVSAFVMLASFAALFGILTALAMTGSWRNLLPAAIPFIFGISFVFALAWRQRRQWLREHPLPEQPPDSGGHLPGNAAFTVIVVVLLLALAGTGNAMGMMIGSGLALLIGLIGFAKGNFRLGLLVALASLGVAGTTVLLINRKQAAPPIQKETAAFSSVIEVTLSVPSVGGRCVLDFETGSLLEPPAEVVPVLNNYVSQLPPAALRWLRDSGADAVLAPDGSVRLIEGVVFNPTRQGKALAWDEFTPGEVTGTVAAMSERQRRASVDQPTFHLVTLRQPAAVAFTTRERSCGVLQILGASDYPLGLKLRYKLVSGENNQIAAPHSNKYSSTLPSTEAANEYLDLELAFVDAFIAQKDAAHPDMIAAISALDGFKKNHPPIPDAVLKGVREDRLARLKKELRQAEEKGIDHAKRLAMQDRYDVLADLVTEPDRIWRMVKSKVQEPEPPRAEAVFPPSDAPKQPADMADEKARKETLDAIDATNDTNRFLDLELAVIDAKSSGMGDGHPSVIAAADVLARFKETHPNVPDDVWRKLVGERLDKAKEDLTALTKNGLGHAHPAVKQQQARIRALAEMIGKPESAEAPQETPSKPSPIPPEALRAVEEYARAFQSTTRRDLGLGEVREKMKALDQRWKDALKGTACQPLLDQMEAFSKKREVAEHAGNAAEVERLSREIRILGDTLTDLLTDAGIHWPGLDSFSLRWVARANDSDTIKVPDATSGDHVRVMRNALLEPSVIETMGWSQWNGASKELFLTLKGETTILTLQQDTSERLGDRLAVVWQGKAIGVFEVKQPLSNGLEIPLTVSDADASKLERELKQAAMAPVADKRDKVIIEDLALHMIVAIREKDDAKLKSLATDRIKGWPEALPVFAVELREHMRQFTGDDKFDLRAGESLVEGDLGVVRCTGPAALEGKCLVLMFVRTGDGWKNQLGRNAMVDVPLAGLLAEFRKQLEKAKPAEAKPEK